MIVLLLLAGCTREPAHEDMRADIHERSGFYLPESTVIGDITLPPEASLDDGVSEDEAVSIALWNNAAFQETLVELDIARGDLIQAGLLPNPLINYTFSGADKPYKYAFELPLEALWLMPLRIDAAQADTQATAHRLSQAGLNLINNARRAYSDVVQAQTQYALLKESAILRTNIADLTKKQFEAGDISKQQVTLAQLDAMSAQQDEARARYDAQGRKEQLRFVMGIGSYEGALTVDASPNADCSTKNVAALVEEGLRNRPDALAAQETIISAEARADLSRFNWLGLTAIADATSGRDTGHELSPALRGSIPLFNINQGNITRANAQEQQAARAEQTVAHQIRLDINQAYILHQQACNQLAIMQNTVITEVEDDLVRMQSSYKIGNVPYLMVLQSMRSVIDTKLRQAQLAGDVQRASFELERAVGRRLPDNAAQPTPPINMIEPEQVTQ